MARSHQNSKRGKNNGKQFNSQKQSKQPEVEKGSKEKDSNVESGSGSTEIKDKGPSINDPEWYSRDVQLLIDSASLNFADPLGTNIELANGNERVWGGYPTTDQGLYIGGVSANNRALPGICTLFMKHSIGDSHDRNDPANIAAQALYTMVRVVNSGRKNYDASDLMMYVYIVSELYAYLQWCKRLYGFAFMYSQRNLYIGKSLIEENIVDPTSMLNNLANFRYWVNTFANKIASFVLPADIPYVSRRRFMYDGLYLENPYDNLKDQLYMFAPEGFFKFGLDTKGRTTAKWTPLTINPETGLPRTRENFLTVDDIMLFGNELIGAIMGDEDFALMCGDILKAYGSNIMTAEGLPSEYFVMPHYDMTVLSQFKNATLCGGAARGGINETKFRSSNDSSPDSYIYPCGDICQDDQGNIVSLEATPCSAATATSPLNVFMKKALSLEIPAPGPADNIEATRLMVIGTRGNLEYTQSEVIVMLTGVDYPTVMRLRTNDSTPAETPVVLQERHNLLREEDLTLNEVEIRYAFKYAPTVYNFRKESGGVGDWITLLRVASNLDNYTIVNGYVLDKMHSCALLSLFFVPGIAKMVNYAK